MGYAIPATIGVLTKNPELRPIVIVGDGAFQMTGHEISCFVRYNLKPIIFLLNNKGYTTQRYLKDGNYNDIQDWNYHLFPQIFGSGLGLEVKTEGELEEALLKAKNNTESFTIINIHIDKYDKSDTLGRLTSIFSKNIV
jgi:indolepyruvate decarboxylase